MLQLQKSNRVADQDITKGPKDDWTDKEWLQYSHIMVHSPWISDSERDYWRKKITELT